MSQEKIYTKEIADKLSKYICICMYIYMYPTLIVFIKDCLDIDVHQIFYLYSNFVSTMFLFLSIMGSPSILWFLTTKIFKKIHPTITAIYFVLFIIWQILIFLFVTIIIVVDQKEQVANSF